jgi:hypothetical protein
MKVKNITRNDGDQASRTQGSVWSRPGSVQDCLRREGARPGRRGIFREEGANLVEMALACSVFFAMLFGIIEFCLVFNCYTFVAEAAREATRYAVIRGSDSCLPSASFPNCDLNPTGATNPTSGNPLQTYVQGLGYPFAKSMAVSATWWGPPTTSSSSPPATSWPTQCTTASFTDSGGATLFCNAPGNQVQVTVSYTFPLHIPFWKAASIPLSSTSEMMISY